MASTSTPSVGEMRDLRRTDRDVIDVPSDDDETPMSTVPAVIDTPTTSLVRPAGSPADVAEAFAEYAQVCDRVLDDGDYQTIGNRRYRTKSAWRKLAVAYGVDITLDEERTERDEHGALLRVHCTVRATAPNGRKADGVGSCDLREKCCTPTCKTRHAHCPAHESPGACDGARHYSHAEHDVRGTAYTRAANRACADLFGLGEVSAEEMSGALDPAASAVVTRETFDALVATAKAAKETGVPLIEWPNVLGLVVFDTSAKQPTLTESQAAMLMAVLTALSAHTSGESPENDDAETICAACHEPIRSGQATMSQGVGADARYYHGECAPL